MGKVVKVKNVCSVQTYTDQNGEKKNLYRQIGRVTEFDNGGESLELYMFPGIRFSIMPQTQTK